ncbi:MAG: DUF3604 domain-containing protein [Planctomycetota bacterium]
MGRRHPGPAKSRARALRAAPAALAALACASCGEAPGAEDPAHSAGPDEAPATARWSQVEQFRADQAAVRHASDGRGVVRLVEAPERVRARGVGRWVLELVVDEAGIAESGVITFLPDPFWGWSTPQTLRADLPGYTATRVTRGGVEPEGVTLRGSTLGGAEGGLLALEVTGGPLRGGDVVRIDYGAGEAGARADRYAGREARLWVGVDGDGDGVRGMIADSPSVEVAPRAPERAVLLGPSIARPGATARYHVSALDGWANAAPEMDGVPWRCDVSVEAFVRRPGAPAPEREALAITPEQPALDERGFATFDVVLPQEIGAVVRLAADLPLPGGGVASALSNPLLVDPDEPPILWADLHGHTGRSDGTGSVRDYFTYARDTARLDVLALTDHDHFGSRFLDATPTWWDEMLDVTESFHAPGRFVTVFGFEWTSWIHGHRHVLYFERAGARVLSSIDEAHDTPLELWDALRGRAAMTLAHHSSGHPIPVNWSYPPDPTLEPLTEVVSVHGSSEARDAPHVVAGSRDGRFVRDQLDRGYRLGFIGSGDSHDGHPGLPHLSPGYGWRPATAGRGELAGTGGLAAIRTGDRTRAGVLAALRERRTYATSGPRIVTLTRWNDGRTRLRLRAIGRAPIARIVLVLGPRIDAAEGAAELRDVDFGAPTAQVETVIPVPDANARRYVYVRVEQADRAAAWVGPFWPDEGR